MCQVSQLQIMIHPQKMRITIKIQSLNTLALVSILQAYWISPVSTDQADQYSNL
jgi:hypothetical protein